MNHHLDFKKGVVALGLAGFVTLAHAGTWSSPMVGDFAALENPEAAMTVQGPLDWSGLDPMLPDMDGVAPDPLRAALTPSDHADRFAPPSIDAAKTITGTLEIGGMYTRGDNGRGAGGSNKFNEYRDMSNGVFINHFDFSSSNENAYFNAEGGAVDRTDQYYDLQTGQSNWTLRGSFDEDDHVYSETVRPADLEPYNGPPR